MHTSLGPKAVKIIEAAIRNLFVKIRGTVLGGRPMANKDLAFRYRPELTLTGIFETAAEEEGAKPDPQILNGLLSVADSYLTATEARTSARTVQAVQSFLTDAHNGGIETDLPTVLGGHLADVFADVTHEVRRIVETESTTVRNMSIMDGIVKGNELAGVDDPTVFFIVVRDADCCVECRRLHMMSDGVTPRLWKLSQVKAGYHTKGDAEPSLSGLHPHCRCMCSTLMPGYSFNTQGHVTYKSPKHDEFAAQNP